jgi:maltose alpha-D-glucosyltransferase / alpha-amylase
MSTRSRDSWLLNDEPLWYKDAVIYQLHVRAFADSDGDGIGDFKGLTQKLDYLQDLGVTAIWLLPFYPSPLKDDGYDIADYTDVHPSYGTLRDFQTFLYAAHRRGLRVITELVINHTSDQHPWFDRARRAKAGSSHRDFYVWSETPDRYNDARIIFKDFESSNWSLDPVTGLYYWHRFYHHQPDLNFDNPAVKKAVFRIMDFWLGMGVDGLRLDAVPYLFERDGTNCENLPETHAFLKELRAYMDKRYPNRMILAEANQWPEDAIAYFGEGDESHMNFHFPVMPRLFMAIRMEDRFPIVDILRQTPAIPDNCQWAMFLRNHDELTLEMVTDEERDYMYRVYAVDPQARINLGIRRRLAPLLNNNIRQMELMNGLLFSMPGTPVIYYGDEIGMGDNVYLGDRNGVRTPMQWSADRNAGFSRGNPQRLYAPVIVDPAYHYEAVNVEAEQSNPELLLWWMKRLINLRKRFPVFGRGSVEFLYPDNAKVLAFLRKDNNDTVLVVANLSRYAQFVELDLSGYEGMGLTEMFGQSAFPPIGESPYSISLGPHSFYWFSIQSQAVSAPNLVGAPTESPTPVLSVRGRWEALFDRQSRHRLADTLLDYARDRRWFGGKARNILSAEVLDAVPMPFSGSTAYLTLLRVDYSQGEPETYFVPVAYANEEVASQLEASLPLAVIAEVNPIGPRGDSGILYDALADANFDDALLDAVRRRRVLRAGSSEVTALPTAAFRSLRGPISEPLPSQVLDADQSNTSILFGQRLILKLFRRPGTGINPDVEVGRHLTERAKFPFTARLAGAIEYRPRHSAEPVSLCVLHEFVENQGDAWRLTMDSLGQFFERAVATSSGIAPNVSEGHILELDSHDLPEEMQEAMGVYLPLAALLGTRTAELHRALASPRSDPVFAPEPFSLMYQRSLYSAMRGQASQTVQFLRRRISSLPEDIQGIAQEVVDSEAAITSRFARLLGNRIYAMRTRCHGDFHLGQVLYTGKDFAIIDFEGEPARPVSERRLKRSPLVDVAGMLRSFDYAANAALRGYGRSAIRLEDVSMLQPWAAAWTRLVSAEYLTSYLELMATTAILPEEYDVQELLLDAFLLDKAMYEVRYELNSRPDWTEVPLRGVLDLLRQGA